MNLALKKSILKWALVTLAFILIVGCSRNSSPASGNQNQKNTTTNGQQNTTTSGQQNTTTSGQQNTTSNNSTPSSTSSDASKSIVYKNTQYGFSFNLPANWSGYSIITSQWEGIATGGQNGSTVVETGPIISIRDPKWTKETPRQDIPIMVFTLNQWNSLKQEVFHIGAAPVDPTELGRNNYYVFALPARYNFALLPGYKDVENILAGNPLQTAQTTNLRSDSTEILLSKIRELAKLGRVINCNFSAKTTTIDDVEKVWGKADKTDWIAAAKGFYSTYSKHNVVFGFNKGNQIFEIRSWDGKLMSITTKTSREVLGTPAYDVKINGQEIIGYKINSSFKLELVFPQPTNSKPYPVIDHYNVLYPDGTINSMANDPGRQW